MGEWWRRTDGQPGLSWSGAIVVGVIVAVGFFVWAVVTDDGPIDGDAVGATGGGLLAAVLARLDIRQRVRRSGRRDVEQIRWRRALRRMGRSRRS